MHFDLSVPPKLKTLQTWFGSVILQPLESGGGIRKEAPSGLSIESEARRYIAASRTLQPFQRIELYNQQYWWRLLAVLHESFPTLIRLFGEEDFNRVLGIPYLCKYPSRSWNLNLIGNQLPKWIDEDYTAQDRQLVLHAASVDDDYNRAFCEACHPSLNDACNLDGDAMLTIPLIWQPHVRLYTFPYNFFLFREALLQQEPEHWLKNDFPQMEKGAAFHNILFQGINKVPSWQPLDPSEYALLVRFKERCTFSEAIDWLEQQPIHCVKAEKRLNLWIQKWVALRWLRRVD